MMLQPHNHNEMFNPDGHLSEQAVALFAEALKYSGAELMPDEVSLHVEDCFDCKAAILDVSELISLDELPPLAEHPYFSKAVGSPLQTPLIPLKKPGKGGYFFLKIAAGLVLVTAISLLLMIVIKNISPQKPAISRQDTAGNFQKQQLPGPNETPDDPTAADPAQIAAVFTPNPALAKLVSGQTRAPGFKMLSPKPEAAFSTAAKLVFSWQTEMAGPFLIRIMDNTGKVKFERSVNDMNLTVSELSAKGLYYWFISADDDLVSGGSFTMGK